MRRSNRLLRSLLLALALPVVYPASAESPEELLIRRSMTWLPSDVLIKSLSLEAGDCSAYITASSFEKRKTGDTDRIEPEKKQLSEQENVVRQHAAEAAVEALLLAREMTVPSEYDSVWLDYQTARAMQVAGQPQADIDALLELLARPKSRVYEEQLFGREWQQNGPVAAAESGFAKENCEAHKVLTQAIKYPEELIKVGLNGWVIVKAKMRADSTLESLWVHSSSHVALEKAARQALKKVESKTCAGRVNSPTKFLIIPMVFTLEFDGPFSPDAANKPAEPDPVYRFEETKAYRDIAGPGHCVRRP